MARLEPHPTCQIPGLDKIYEQHFGDEIGTFVEVGAFDGMTYSNTWHLANAGWAGIYIEAHPDFARQCIHNHRYNHKIETIACACGSFNGEIDLTVYGEVSTTVLSKWNRDWGMNEQTPKIKVPQKELSFILGDFNYPKIDLLVIDVEEAEIEVLKGFTLDKYKPKMIIIELHELQGTRLDQKGWQEPWVTNYLKGYRKIYYDAINTIFIRNDA